MTDKFREGYRWSAWLAGILICTGCSSGPKTETRHTNIVPVRILTVTPDVRAVSHDYIGVIEEESASSLSFQVAGHVQQIDAREGQRVAAGDVLAVLDTRNLQSIHEGSLASLKQAEDAMKRLQMLYDKQSLPEIQYVEAQTKLQQARSMEEVARKNLEDSRLIAPFGGVIGRRQVETGENVMPGQPVLSLLKTGTVKVRIPVPENEIASVHSGTRARITVAALDNQQFEGSISEKGIEADPVAHTYEARIPLNNASGVLMPGMVCRVELLKNDAQPNIVLPNKAVQLSETGERFVWTVREGAAVRTPVQTSELSEAGLIITEGLSEGDQVICEGYQKISEGMQVQVQP